jgi:TolB-like protein
VGVIEVSKQQIRFVPISDKRKLASAALAEADHPRFIETLHKRGYRFIASQISPADKAIGARPAYLRDWKTASLAALGLLTIVAGDWLLSSNREPAFESIAVLPFVNSSGDPKIEYITDGISEGLIRRLSKVPNLTVRPPGSGIQYKEKKADPQTVAKELRVKAVVIGRVNQQGDFLIVDAELVDAVNNRTLWGETYHSKRSELLEVERGISLEICNRLHQTLNREEQARMKTNPTQPGSL